MTCIHQNYDFQKNPPNQKKTETQEKNRGEPKVPQFWVPNWSLISIENSTTNNVWGFQQHSHHSESSQEASIGQALDRQVNQMKVKTFS